MYTTVSSRNIYEIRMLVLLQFANMILLIVEAAEG